MNIYQIYNIQNRSFLQISNIYDLKQVDSTEEIGKIWYSKESLIDYFKKQKEFILNNYNNYKILKEKDVSDFNSYKNSSFDRIINYVKFYKDKFKISDSVVIEYISEEVYKISLNDYFLNDGRKSLGKLKYKPTTPYAIKIRNKDGLYSDCDLPPKFIKDEGRLFKDISSLKKYLVRVYRIINKKEGGYGVNESDIYFANLVEKYYKDCEIVVFNFKENNRFTVDKLFPDFDGELSHVKTLYITYLAKKILS